jgi:hypothetical protein
MHCRLLAPQAHQSVVRQRVDRVAKPPRDRGQQLGRRTHEPIDDHLPVRADAVLTEAVGPATQAVDDPAAARILWQALWRHADQKERPLARPHKAVGPLATHLQRPLHHRAVPMAKLSLCDG